MFQRLKNSIDSRIADEQARQRALQTTPSRSNSGNKRSIARAASPAVRSSRPRQTDGKGEDGQPKSPDPKEFEPEFVIEDDEPLSRAGTPKPTQAKNEDAQAMETTGEKPSVGDGIQVEKERDKESGAPQTMPPLELPTEVRVKLRKLERLETKYGELLRSYRIAHARVSAIEPFENALRENTPLTSINDPSALVEYLNQLNLKGDMVIDELKRVSGDRDALKQKLLDAERKTREAWEEVGSLREQKETADTSTRMKSENLVDEPMSTLSTGESETSPKAEDFAPEKATKSPPLPNKSRTPTISGLSLFPPRSKPVEAPPVEDDSEEFFSYDGEIPRLESELKKRQNEISELQCEVQTLKGDLNVARESTQSMVQTLEEATRELNMLNEQKDQSEARLIQKQHELQDKIIELQADLEAADGNLRQTEMRINQEDGQKGASQERLLTEANAQLEKMCHVEAEKAEAVANVVRLRSEMEVLQSRASEMESEKEQNARHVNTLQELVDNMKERLAMAEQEKERLQVDHEEGCAMIESLQQQVTGLKEGSSRQTDDAISQVSTPKQQEVEEMVVDGKTSVEGSAGKKKSKKKKKGSKAINEQKREATSTPVDIANDLTSNLASGEVMNRLKAELLNLRAVLEEKDAALKRLHDKLKDQEDLKEEIESLRDDLITVGQEHVMAKDRIKNLLVEKEILEKTASELEGELTDLRKSHASTAEAEENSKELTSRFEDLKSKAANLQSDLSVAQQLASSRFKDFTDVRTILQKAQPELTALRKENTELKTIKEELTVKITALQKIETRHNNMQIEFVELKKVLGEKDLEIKSLLQKLASESSSRSKAEEISSKASQDLQRSEAEKTALAQSIGKLSRDLVKSREDLNQARSRLHDLEDSISRSERDSSGLREEVELKTAQYASAESLMSSMRDQTTEMAVQTKEARERCESLEEEVAEAHRLLSERSREAETMRRMLADVETRTDSRLREIKERMEVAIEERDRAEDEASITGRRKARELEELKNKLRDLERDLRRAEDDREELKATQRDWKKRREELEQKSEQSEREVEEVKKAMGELRDTLDESERQARSLEKQKAELRRSVEETQLRLDKLQKSNKSLADEVRTMQATKIKGPESQAQSPRSSIDSSRAKVGSPINTSRANSLAVRDGSNGQSSPSIDYVYVKNVLLQFLEQDKKHQIQLIPALGRILHFDGKDEQKWMAAITAK